MKTIKRLVARATATACLTAVLFAPATFAQAPFADDSHDAFDSAVSALSADASSWMEEDDATSDIARMVATELENELKMSALDWQTYGNRLHDALSVDHAGLRHSALRLIIAYSDNLDLGNETVVELMKIYRDDDSEQARRMAVVALAELDSELAVDYLERSHTFEKSDTVKRTIAAVVSAHRTS